MPSGVDTRAMGQYPLSIATSLAIESACGIHPEMAVDEAPILHYDELWINVRTLFRNFIGALEKGEEDFISTEACVEAINLELSQIHKAIKEASNGRTNIIFYVSNYIDIDAKYRYAVIRRDTTAKQKMFTALMKDVITMLLKQHPEDNFHVVRLKLKPEKKTKAMIITHIVYDLVVWKEFEHLTLLESHTGAIRERAQWHRKFLNGEELPMIPFREDFLQVFGDKETFRPMDIKLRKELIDIAVQYRWNPTTTREMIKYGVDQMKNPLAKEILRAVLV